MTDLLTAKEAAQRLGVDIVTLGDILAVGDIVPDGPQGFKRTQIWARIDEIRLADEDIELIKVEIHRRRFVDFKSEYADILALDPRPGGRGLEFGPGWLGILLSYADGLRELKVDGRQAATLRWGKEKFGALRLFSDYILAVEKQVIDLHRQAYRSSLVTCQECGEPARLRWGHGLCLTLCERHKHIVGEPDLSKDGIILDVNAWTKEQGEA